MSYFTTHVLISRWFVFTLHNISKVLLVWMTCFSIVYCIISYLPNNSQVNNYWNGIIFNHFFYIHHHNNSETSTDIRLCSVKPKPRQYLHIPELKLTR